MAAKPARHRRRLLLVAGGLVVFAPAPAALAFPDDDATRALTTPTPAELAAPDAQDLRHQLQLSHGLPASNGGGWTFVPRLTWQEMVTDNALQQESARSSDLVNILSPGIAIVGDTARVQLKMDYSPTLAIYTRNGSQNAVTQQMNGTGLITIVPDLAFIDLRAVAGVQARNGGFGGLGTLGSLPSTPTIPGSAATPTNNYLGLSRQNLVQTSSFGISPYLKRVFGDYGTARVGFSVNASRSAGTSGFVSSPVVTDGANVQNLFSTEQNAQFVTGEFLGRTRDTLDIRLLQSKTTGQRNANSSNNTSNNTTSNRETISNRVDYSVTNQLIVFGSFGYENIRYRGAQNQTIIGPTWSIGTTLHPDPDSELTVSYGHRDGYNSFQASARYAVTARTTATLNYNSRLGTQLQYLQSQLNGAAFNSNGALVNGETGGPTFTGTNALGVNGGLYRFDTFSATVRTILDRDQITLTMSAASQTATGTGTSPGNSSQAKTITLQWVHELGPRFLLSTYGSVSLISGGNNVGTNPTVIGSASLQYAFSDTLTGMMRYSMLDRRSSTPGQSIYQNLFIVGVTKQF